MEIFNQLKQPFEELETLFDEHDKILKAKTMYRIIITLYWIKKHSHIFSRLKQIIKFIKMFTLLITI